ncbi:MAG: HEAT repeat domain-containing protein [Vicinamibacteria bacterium]|nr:HEAT repeat domain-containing protein [Vicinamibacteria bacterium]
MQTTSAFRAGLLALALILARSTRALEGGPEPARERIRLIDIHHISLDLTFDLKARQARGAAAITLSLLRPAARVALDAGMLAIESVTLANGTPLAFAYDGGDSDDGLVISLDRSYAAGESVAFTIAYRTRKVNESDPNSLSGSNGKGLRFFSPTSTEPIKRPQIWSMGEFASNRYWFPGYDAPDDFRTLELRATVPAPLTAIGNGELVSTSVHADGTRTFHWKMDIPHPNHQTTFVASEYTEVKQAWDSIPLHSFSYPDEREATAASVVRVPDMMRFFSELTGARYPFSRYSQVFVQDLPWGVTGSATATLTENMVDDEPTHEDYRFLWDGLSAEALARQWFTGRVAARDWRHQWLDRAFGHYFDGLYNEYRNGREEFLLWQMQGDMNFYLAAFKAQPRYPVVAAGSEDQADFGNSVYPYNRGALVLHMLRKHVGEEAWRRAIRRYVAANSGHPVTTDDFRRAVEQESGESLRWFFDQWVFKAGHPVFEVASRYDEVRRLLTLDVKQTQAGFFEGKLDIAIDGRVEAVWLEAAPLNTFTFPQAAAPRIVGFDHESTWIKEVVFPKSLDELIEQARRDTDVTGRRWAMAEMVKLARADGTVAAEKAMVLSTLLKIAESDPFWRLRYNALLQLTGLLTPPDPARPAILDPATTEALVAAIGREKSWVRSAAVGALGLTRDPKFAPLYAELLCDVSHPVSYAAAIALGRSRSPRAFRALSDVMKIPSWKGENILSGLIGLKELGDPRAAALALQAVKDQAARRWTLATSRWDFRIAGAETLAALGKGALAYPIVAERLSRSMAENDVNDIFSNALLIATLGDPRGQAAFDLLKTRYKDDAPALTAVKAFEAQFNEALRKP